MVEFTWIAHYTDGSKLELKEGAKYPDINRQKLLCFDIMDKDKLVFRQKIEPGEIFFYRRRTAKRIFVKTLEELADDYCYITGIKDKEYFVSFRNKSVVMYQNDPQIELFDYEVPCRNGN